MTPRLLARCLVAWLFALALASAHASAATTVSLTFDDASADQAVVPGLLAARGLHGTLYVPSGRIGSRPYDMTWPQVRAFAAAGNELGGHTVHHVDLTALDPAAQAAEICGDRANFVAQGLPAPVTFAYPLAHGTPDLEAIVAGCGYRAARNVGAVGCPACAPAETLPPADPFALRTITGVTPATDTATMEGYVTRAEAAGGGWVIFVFHNICADVAGCGANGTTRARFEAFLDWLRPRADAGTVVRTVAEVVTGSNPVLPASGPGSPASPPGSPPVAARRDTSPPVTALVCGRRPCGRVARPGVRIGFRATDRGGSTVAVTCWATRGRVPRIARGRCVRGSSARTLRLHRSTTVRYRSADAAGNVERVRSRRIVIRPARRSASRPAAAGSRR